MPDRADLAAAGLAVACFAVGALDAILVPGAMTSGGPSLQLYLVMSVPVFAYAAYWAFGIRHALAVRLYRRQALGIGVLVIAMWATILAFVLVPNATSPLLSFAQISAFSFLFIVLFYWIDASALAARRSDPLLRDTLRWSRVRIPLWAVLLVGTLLPIAILVYVQGTGSPALIQAMNAGTLGGPIFSLFLNDVIFNLPVVVPVCGIVLLPAMAVRSKWDRSLRLHFAWFVPVAVAVLLIFFGPVAGTPNGLLSLLMTAPLLIFAGYSLYRSAKALVPLNRMATPSADPP